jgi:hypothetical protein
MKAALQKELRKMEVMGVALLLLHDFLNRGVTLARWKA